jgi:hypothetical protein
VKVKLFRYWDKVLTFFILWSAVMLLPRLSLSQDQEQQCTYTREYITALEFLRSSKEFAIPELEARKTAERVSAGCSGAADRFIRVVQILTRSEMGSKDSIQIGLQFSAKTNAETQTFIHVFSKAFLSEYLDLDLQSAVKMAISLSSEFQGDSLGVRDDFERLLYYCSETKTLDLPKPQCGSFAARIAHLGERFSGGIADSFLRIYEFLISEKGPHLVTGQALALSEQLVTGGRDSADNFIQAYKYGVSSVGLNQSHQDALQFAKQMVKSPLKEPTQESSSGLKDPQTP